MNGDGYGRLLNCTRCGALVRVYELPGPFIDPELYVGCACGCARPVGEREPEQPQLALLGTLEETRDYDPTIAAIPF